MKHYTVMNIANELYGAGLLSRDRTQIESGYEFSRKLKQHAQLSTRAVYTLPETPHGSTPSLKVSRSGWRLLKNALR